MESRLAVTLPAAPESLSRARRELRDFLRGAGRDDTLAYDVQVGVCEALSLVLEETEAEEFSLEGAFEGGQLGVTIRAAVSRVQAPARKDDLHFRILCALTEDVEVGVEAPEQGALAVRLLFAP
jgi:hypothetical protein